MREKSVGFSPALHRIMQMASLEGDVLGIVFSFLSAGELVCDRLFLVSKEWRRVLCTLPHSWGLSLDLSWSRCGGGIPNLSQCTFAWHRTRVSQQPTR